MTKLLNILFITADQWRGDSLSALSHPTVKTPHLDALAADGVLFRNHFAQCTPCGPSRASLYTGMYMMNHRSVRNGVPLDARFTNIALEARKAGYDPSLIGYTDTSPDPRGRHPNDPVLTTYAGVLPGFKQMVPGSDDKHYSAWCRYLVAKGYQLPEDAGNVRGVPISNYPGARERGPTFAPLFCKAEDSDTAFMADRALEFISEQDGGPWFLHLSLERPHSPYVAPEPYNTLYRLEDVPDFRRAPSADEEAGQHPYTAYMVRHHLQRESLDADGHPTDERAQRQLRATYYGLMTEVDHHVGRLVTALRESGQYDSTVIVFTSDHGDQLWDHWMVGKETYFDQSYHVPLIVRAPGLRADKSRGRIVEAFTEHVDVMPTFMEWVGLDVPLQCDGESLGPFLRGETPAGWRREVHWELDFRDILNGLPETELNIRLDECMLCVIRDSDYKYVHFAALPPLLFDLKKDPDELHDLAAEPSYRDKVLAYAQKMLSWRMVHGERTLTGIRLSDGGAFECPPSRR